VLVNFADTAVVCPAAGHVVIASDGLDEGAPYPGVLRGACAVVLAA
jgi:hypothetical protein